MVRHKNRHGYWENLDSLPVRDCYCGACKRARRGEQASAIAEAVVTGAFAVGGLIAGPQQSSADTQSNWADTKAQHERTRQSKDMDDATRDKSNRNHGTSQQD